MDVKLTIDGVEYTCTPKGTAPPVQPPERPETPEPPVSPPVVGIELSDPENVRVHLGPSQQQVRLVRAPDVLTTIGDLSYQGSTGLKSTIELIDSRGVVVGKTVQVYVTNLRWTTDVVYYNRTGGASGSVALLKPGETYKLRITNEVSARGYLDEQRRVLRA